MRIRHPIFPRTSVILVGVVFLRLWECQGFVRHGVLAFSSTKSRSFIPLFSKVSMVDVEDPRIILSTDQTKLLESLVEERSEARWQGNYTRADFLKQEIQSLELPSSYQVIVTDIPRKLGGGSEWKLVQYQEVKPVMDGQTILQLAHSALGLAVESTVQANLGRAHMAITGKENDISSQIEEDKRHKKLESIVQQAKERFNHVDWTDSELAGRKAADAAFWFALAGVTDDEIFQILVHVATRELRRFGERNSCRSKDIYQMMARFSAAGIENVQELEDVARQCLSVKEGTLTKTTEINEQLLDFHSDRSLLLIWKFSTKQKKQRAFLKSALKHWQRQKDTEEIISKDKSDTLKRQDYHYDWINMFSDPTRPLVVDVGCGMGVSILGLSRGNSHASAKCLFGSDSSLLWEDYNYVGVDLGGLGISYARSLASRWGVTSRLQFVVDSAEDFMQQLRSYPGSVSLCLIQFPTPYKLKPPGNAHGNEKSGNSQLPVSAEDGFMVSKRLLGLVKNALSESNGRLLLQSNCEDVAIHMKDIACNQVGFSPVKDIDKEALKAQNEAFSSSHVDPRIPQRTADWIEMGGERAMGTMWCDVPILPRKGATETEVACGLNGTPVHRCLLEASTSNIR